jgi:acetyl esterase
MAIDPELASFLVERFPNDMDDIVTSRRLQAQLSEKARRQSEPITGVSWRDEAIASLGDEGQLTVRIYQNEIVTGPSGALLFFHGGAFVFGDLESEHARCLTYAKQADCVVVSVAYRLAPEHPYPAAHDDSVSALEWLRRNCDSLGVDASRIAVGGASAGGAVAAGLVLRVRDDGDRWLRAQLLIYPAVDNETSTASMERFSTSEPWDGERTKRMWQEYLAGHVGDVPAYAAPARAHDLSGLPPTYIMTAEEDPLRDEAIEYAQRLLEAGNVVELHHFARTFHGFDLVATGTSITRQALDEQVAFLSHELAVS